jgi:tetratricopeptide (TPR) repeat protein
MQGTQLSAGYQALRQGQADAAIDRADEYLRERSHGPGVAEAYYLKGRGYELKTASNRDESKRNWVEARTAYAYGLNENPAPQLEASIRAGLSNVAFFMDDYPTAFAEASKAYSLTNSPETQSVLLYRMGVSQARMGRFTEADDTFALVQQRYPGSPMARRAQEHQGVRNFYLQLATYGTAEGADRAIESLKSSGLALSKRAEVGGHVVVNAGPFATYDAVKQVKQRLAGEFPDALVVP